METLDSGMADVRGFDRPLRRSLGRDRHESAAMREPKPATVYDWGSA